MEETYRIWQWTLITSINIYNNAGDAVTSFFIFGTLKYQSPYFPFSVCIFYPNCLKINSKNRNLQSSVVPNINLIAVLKISHSERLCHDDRRKPFFLQFAILIHLQTNERDPLMCFNLPFTILANFLHNGRVSLWSLLPKANVAHKENMC